ncbi:hypothetical protein J2Z69_002949 [Paenibacillus shirakamiensis]|uniref:Uncharacterized protein n=1 Tax=Paenibacillus shirakamiensis TaxID=1265935 RepID=A0ABS4JJK3_9BACL|nr:hypothetical protein [Paenibacillus shirakamiensis]MBP2001893.1 hypothetical protein [Paenibacillus shirakamiensis]
MAILLPNQIFNLGPNVGKSFFEDLTGGRDATVTVNNTGAVPVSLVLTRVNAPVITYVIPPQNSLTLAVHRLLVAAILAGTGPSSGSIEIASTDF